MLKTEECFILLCPGGYSAFARCTWFDNCFSPLIFYYSCYSIKIISMVFNVTISFSLAHIVHWHNVHVWIDCPAIKTIHSQCVHTIFIRVENKMKGSSANQLPSGTWNRHHIHMALYKDSSKFLRPMGPDWERTPFLSLRFFSLVPIYMLCVGLLYMILLLSFIPFRF